MKKITTLLAIALFTINASAQEAKPANTEKTKKESCCMAKESHTKTMSAEDVAICQAKCKAEGKKCDAKTSKKEDKKCCAKKV
tara:strand:+ start:11233 stop:11481 length:249 start_codon:yes stop_codon:yes gene_type:complete